jgi:hypothetical protein
VWEVKERDGGKRGFWTWDGRSWGRDGFPSPSRSLSPSPSPSVSPSPSLSLSLSLSHGRGRAWNGAFALLPMSSASANLLGPREEGYRQPFCMRASASQRMGEQYHVRRSRQTAERGRGRWGGGGHQDRNPTYLGEVSLGGLRGRLVIAARARAVVGRAARAARGGH